MTMNKLSLLPLCLLFAGAAFAHEYKAGDIVIGHPYARATVPGQPAAAAFIGLDNKGTTGDRLVGASTPMAKSVEIHSMSLENNVMRMREVQAIDVAPGTKISMKPGNGYHLMLIGPAKELKAGDKFPMTLVFDKAGKVEVSVSVEANAPKAAAAPAPAAPAEGAHQHQH